MSCQFTKYFGLILIFFFVFRLSHSVAQDEVDKKNFIFAALWKEIYGDFPVVQDGVKESVIKEDTTPSPKPIPTPDKKEEEKKLSKGQSYVQEALKKNRELIKKQNEEKKKREKEAALSYEGEKSFSDEMKEKESQFLDNSKKNVSDAYQKWKSEMDETYKRWAKEKEKFMGRVEEYKENTFKFDEYTELMGARGDRLDKEKSEVKGKLDFSKIDKNNFFIVDEALNLPIKDQGNRSTCSAFAAVRGLEILYKQKNKTAKKFSEQYFYFASKPECQTEKCTKKGSWVIPGLERSKNNYKADIPLESDCNYKNFSVDGNETQIPLSSSCQKGSLKIKNYSVVSSFDEVILALSRNKPIVGGFKLTENFYSNDGLVTLYDAENGGGGKLDSHAAGHALLMVGYIRLPKEKERSEGKLCLIVANSWGEGYGRGGHTCLTEKWFNKYRFTMPFVVLEEII